MSEMIERVARALAANSDFAQMTMATVEAREVYAGNVWRMFVPKARVAIEAMREPTEAMLDAARDVTNGQAFFANYPRKIDAMVHRSMIDAALGQPGQTTTSSAGTNDKPKPL
jgi:hypothetical protein